jgi:lipoprotein-releasing system ATP-binding protein
MNPVISLHRVCKEYPGPSETLKVLQDITFEMLPGACCAIVGPSGSGKSTLLNIMGTLDMPSSGRLLFQGRDVTRLSPGGLAYLRNLEIGFVFQQHHLLPQCTVLENVLLPALASGGVDEAQKRALMLLKRVGLTDRLHHRPGQLSGGERQRAAVARALINRPNLLLADEPTGSLNHEAAEQLAGLLLGINRDEGTALAVVTHSMEIAGRIGSIFELRGGSLTPKE